MRSFLEFQNLTIISLYSQFSFQSKHGLSSPYNFFVPRDNSHISVPLSLIYRLAEKQFTVFLHVVWQSICWAEIVLNNPQVSLLLNSRENEAPEHCCACSLGTVYKQTRRNAFVDKKCLIAEPCSYQEAIYRKKQLLNLFQYWQEGSTYYVMQCVEA